MGPFDQGPCHGSCHPNRWSSGCGAAESGLFLAETSSLDVSVPSEHPVSAFVGLVGIGTSFNLQSCMLAEDGYLLDNMIYIEIESFVREYTLRLGRAHGI